MQNPRRKRFYLPVKIVPVILVTVLVAFYVIVFSVNAALPVLRENINQLPEALRWILSFIFVAGFVMTFYAIFMLIYLVVKRRKPGKKFIVEAVTFVVAFALSWLLKAVVLCSEPEFVPQFDDISRVVLSSFYAAIGGLQFEGLAAECTQGGLFAICCYYGTSIIAGLIFISVIASSAAYEFYSFLLLLFLKTKDKEVYVFTALNDETLNIASSIVESDRGINNKLIIFSGPALEPFDRHDSRCAEVMAHGFIYWSLSGQRNLPIIDVLHLRNAKTKSISVFAFDSDDDHIPNEEENMDYVLLEIHNRITWMAYRARRGIKANQTLAKWVEEGRGDDPALAKAEQALSLFSDSVGVVLSSGTYAQRKAALLRLHRKERVDVKHVSYYILTKRKIDYQAYQDKISLLEREFEETFRYADVECIKVYLNLLDARKTHEANPTDETAKALKAAERAYRSCWQKAMPFSVHVWNEADAIAQEAVRYLNSGLAQNVPDRKQTWICSLGFGTTGQAIAKSLYATCSNLDDAGRASSFLCDAFDPKAGTYLHNLLEMEVPYSSVQLNPETREAIANSYEQKKKQIIAKIAGLCPDMDADFLMHANDEFAFPCFVLHDYSADENGVKGIFAFTPKPKAEGFFDFAQKLPNYFVIAAGDDYENVRLCNALVGYLDRHHLNQKTTVFVNIWDEKNNNLVSGFNRSKPVDGKMPQVIEVSATLRVIIIGNNADIYNCESILANVGAMNYNRVYDEVASGSDYAENEAFNDAAHKYYHGEKVPVLLPKKAIDAAKGTIASWYEIDEETRDKATTSWHNIALWKRVSSISALNFGPVFSRMVKGWKQGEDEGEFYAKLCRVEHQRWMRTHIAEGWTYDAKRDDAKRRHPCLLPIAYIDKGTIAYDLFNIFLGKE